jgi:hypothetical protein
VAGDNAKPRPKPRSGAELIVAAVDALTTTIESGELGRRWAQAKACAIEGGLSGEEHEVAAVATLLLEQVCRLANALDARERG